MVIVTARLAAENRARAYQLGAQSYIAKPYTPDQIFQALAGGAAWRAELEQCGGRGEFALGSCDDQLERDLARFRALLLARTTLDDTRGHDLITVLRLIGQDACRWCGRHQVEPVATARYQIDPDRVAVTIRDQSGWTSGGDFTEASAGFEPRLEEVFDESGPTPSGHEILLVKYCTPRDGCS